MNFQDLTIGQEVVRSIGDYVVGRTGNVVEIDLQKKRARVQWHGETRTWVAASSLEPTSNPYKIIPTQFDGQGRRRSWPKYQRL